MRRARQPPWNERLDETLFRFSSVPHSCGGVMGGDQAERLTFTPAAALSPSFSTGQSMRQMWRYSLSEIVARTFKAGPVELAYIDEGDGEPIVLVHGFASNKEVNWVHPGWVTTLRRAGRRTIALDNRGHGASTKLYDPALYHTELMADDIRALLDHLGLARADIMGYSMGARNTAFLARAHGERVRSA